jgi:hypothetical protein
MQHLKVKKKEYKVSSNFSATVSILTDIRSGQAAYDTLRATRALYRRFCADAENDVGNASHGDQSAFSKRRDPFGRVYNLTAFSTSPAIESIALRSPLSLLA